jgi:hypothetical protein
MTATRHVDATFDGKKLRFELKRNRIEAFEECLRKNAHDDDIVMGASAYAALKRIWGGGWTATDIEQTLAFALETQTREQVRLSEVQKALARYVAQLGTPMPSHYETHTPGDVMPAIERDGHAAYVRLVENILRAALFGISAEEADFDNYVEPSDDAA